ncbi:MAG TPA: nuclear transport factor 2 family protein [Ferruginibacter sp.]|nr:nuclear transport factor 2 family protein [Ferruginibacter sp.]
MSTLTATDNAATVAKLYEAFGRGDVQTIIDNVDDSCEWIGGGGAYLRQGGTYQGKDAANFFKRLSESTEFTAFNPTAIYNVGDNEVASFGNMSGTSRVTGKSSSSDWAMHFKFNDEGKCIYFQDFHNTAAAYVANQP